MQFEVTSVSEHWLTVKPTSPTAYTSGQWDIKKATLVTTKQLECKFIPGSTYKDRTGKEYRFVIYAEEAAPGSRAVFLTSNGNISCRHADGVLNMAGRTSGLDILPNKKTRTICVYRNNTTGSLAAVASDDVGAGTIHFTKIGEVVEEYEEF